MIRFRKMVLRQEVAKVKEIQKIYKIYQNFLIINNKFSCSKISREETHLKIKV
jgi:hypothetical protein